MSPYLNRAEKHFYFMLVSCLLLLSAINPKEHFTWFLETSWVWIGLILVWLTKDSFPLTRILSYLLVIHAIILIVGGYYTYAEVPIGEIFRDLFNLTRNHYDRLGHFAQGFCPAILAREIFLKKSPLTTQGPWLFICVTAVCLSFSAFFEMIEWWASLLFDSKATAFLGTQGDVWDTQWDMFLCLIGAMLSQLLLSSTHNKEISH